MTYDTIIVGAGSAGCVLANRLSENPARRVLLLEAGTTDWHPFIHMPAGIAKLIGKKGINWNYTTTPQAALDNRRLWWPRGRVLGGSSSINAMCYIRGVPSDYDAWAQAAGDETWNWQNVLPVFKRSENNTRGASEWHGAGGPLSVSDLIHHSELSQAFIDAAAAADFARNNDFNGAQQAGFGYYQVTQKNGVRASAAAAFLKPARKRANLAVHTQALATRVLINGTRAFGVEYRHRGTLTRAEGGEVILAGGAVNSPQLLMLSGVGPADHLRAQGVRVALDAPSVGSNLQDHLDICTLQHCTQPITYDKLNDAAVAWQYLSKRQGPGTSNVAEAGGFTRSRYATDANCDVQFHFVPAMLDDHGRNKLPGYGYTVHACFLRPHSRGAIRLASGDPKDAPAIDPNYLCDAEGFDLKMMIEAVKLSRQIFAQTPFDTYRGEEIFPGSAAASDADLEKFIRAKAETIYHPIGTCRMGHDAGAVVDAQLRVRGIEALRVADASIMPTLVGGNTNAPTIMIAEKAAQFILGT